MIIEVCNLCKNEICNYNKTEVIIKDYKGLEFDGCGYPQRGKRKFKGVICDDCLNKLRGIEKSEPPKEDSTIPPKRK